MASSTEILPPVLRSQALNPAGTMKTASETPSIAITTARPAVSNHDPVKAMIAWGVSRFARSSAGALARLCASARV